ncbi:MAG: hypothetical protein KJN89_03185 [Gammaproteobacteria bacterium]|nr:hypothetical protein [Gammaproteobacteria bacterium]MBT8133383.1 hypothetical protein [Gammaproteobacteria bacterium]NNJ49354.1 hypothetical protein [Gammaproteobacteria bacterium]
MFDLPLSLKAWGTDSFDATFKQEMLSLDANLLPLQQGLQNSSYALSDKLTVMVLNTDHDESSITIKAGLFYNGIIAGCNCADDPTPVDETNEYCEVVICISRQTSQSTIKLVK